MPDFDDYGNEIDGELIYCVFPDCGCDGARLCMAKDGASNNACAANVEDMYRRTDKAAIQARMKLVGIVHESDKNKQEGST